MNKILVATDGSDGSGRAIDFAAALARDTGAHLMIVNVIGVQSLPEAVLSQFTRAQQTLLRERLAGHSAQVLQQARERAERAGIAAVQLESRDGDVVQAVLDVAGQAGADMIVVGKRGSGRVAGLLLGSVSQKLVTLADKVVVVVP